MTLVTTRQLVDEAASTGSAVASFNVITVEHAEAIAEGAEQARRPVIMQVSENAVRFHYGRLAPITDATLAVARSAHVEIALHLDHVQDLELLRRAADGGYSSVMVDGGAQAHDANLALSVEAARWAHSVGLWVEAELGYVGGKPDAPQSAHAPGVRTDPDEARAFVAATGVDALAVAVGNAHAMTTRTADLDLVLIERLAAAVPVPLVLHGSSGVSDEAIAGAVKAGMRKINIGTALNIAFTRAVREVLAANPTLVDPRRYLAPARTAMAATVCHLVGAVSGPR